MIQIDGCQYGDQRTNDVRGVQTATEPGLKNDQTHVLTPEKVECEGGSNFKKCWRTPLVDQRANFLDTVYDSFIIDRHAVYLDSFVELNKMWRSEETDLYARSPANRVDHCTYRSLAVRAGDMNESQVVMWISQVGQ